MYMWVLKQYSHDTSEGTSEACLGCYWLWKSNSSLDNWQLRAIFSAIRSLISTNCPELILWNELERIGAAAGDRMMHPLLRCRGSRGPRGMSSRWPHDKTHRWRGDCESWGQWSGTHNRHCGKSRALWNRQWHKWWWQCQYPKGWASESYWKMRN